jgi:hypothetical protein
MSASRIDPAARAMIDQWLVAMNQAADRGDAETIAELARRITDRIELEQQQRRREDEQWELEQQLERDQEWRWEFGVDDDDDDAPDVHPVRRRFDDDE